MPIGPTTYFGKERRFVDREACIQAFKENIQNSGNQEYNVLFYYGIAGIGKSKLQKELQEILDKEYSEILWASIDLDVKTYRDIGTFLITLRNKIQEKHSAKFQLFNAVHAIYWEKFHPGIPLQKQNYPLIKKGDILDKIIGVLENSGKLSLAWEILNSASDSFRKWCKLHHLDISQIESLEPNKIEELLPGIFAADFFEYFGEDSKFYIFIDTYEALWDGLRDKGGFHEKDEWIRDKLIPNMLGVSWVICGREKLLWVPECDPEWDMYLKQHSVDDLPESYCQRFLEDCGIENKDIRDVIIKASEGVPYYLNLSVDTFEKIKIYKKIEQTPQDFGRTQPEVFNTFVKYLYSTEIRALEVLSVANFWDRKLFDTLMKEFNCGFPLSTFSELVKFSFIKTDTDGRFYIHQLMRKSLQGHQDPIDRKNVHEFIFERYNNKLKEIDIKTITQEHEIALMEAFYHAKEVIGTKELFEWFISASKPFGKAAFWKLLIFIYEEMLTQILEAEVRFENPLYELSSVSIIFINLAGLYKNIGNYKTALPLFQRALEIDENIFGSQSSVVAITLNNLAELHHHMGDYKKALPLYQKALNIEESIKGPQHPDVATILSNIAGLYHQVGDYEKVIPLYQRALEIEKSVLGPEHPDVAASLSNLAEIYHSMGDYEKALPLLQRALEIDEDIVGPNHPHFAGTLNNLAELYKDMGDYEKALPLFQRAFEIFETFLGPKHPDVATVLNNLGALHHHMGDYGKALQLYRISLEMAENIMGPNHPDVANSLNNLAKLYRDTKDYEKAILLYQRSLEITENVLSSQHRDVRIALNNLVWLYNQVGDYKKALTVCQRILEMDIKALGSEHLDTVTNLNNLAIIYDNLEDYEKALSLYQMVLEIRERVLGSGHTDVANSLNDLARLYYHMGDYEKALPLYQRVLDIREKVLGPQHPDVATTLNNLAGLYESLGEYKKALPLYQRALDINEKVLGPQHPSVATTLNNLAGLYCHMGEYKKALPLYQRALEIFEKVLSPQHPSVATTLNNLAGLYCHMGEYKKALPLYQRALEIFEKVLGPQHPSVATTLNNLAGLYESLGIKKKHSHFTKEHLK